MIDGLGNLARFVLLSGHRHDSAGVMPLIDGITFDAFFGDKAFDIDWLRAELNRRGARAVIPPKSNRTQTIACDFHMYRWRHLVEHYFCKLKAFRRIATRYEKTDRNFAAMINLVASAIALR
jgi:transposase